ncbi:hypothetical protein ACFY8W_37865 [Streptomyces sp. NPDC012637]|uniref:hypothetical protein n=1 Tax=unclassified Streptomyces TaxID=2593676 RepID=UPI0036EB2391
MTLTKDEELGGLTTGLHRCLELWIRARRATRAPYDVHKAPDPAFIFSRADLSRALRRQHIWAGYLPPGERQRIAGSWSLPSAPPAASSRATPFSSTFTRPLRS